MASALNRPLNSETGSPETRSAAAHDSRLNITVIFTSAEATILALKRAGALAESLGAQVTLVVPQIVPYPLPLTRPPVLQEFQEARFRKIAAESPVEIRVQLYLCRDGWETLKRALAPHSLVVIGAFRTFWPTREKSLARKLRRLGHDVIFNEAN